MTSVAADNQSRIPRVKKSYIYDRSVQNVENQSKFNFKGFEFHKTKMVEGPSEMQKKKALVGTGDQLKFIISTGLTDATNKPSNHGYVNKIRRDSLSGKPKEMKVCLVDGHHSKVGFKSTAAANGQPTKLEKKPFGVKLPDHSLQPPGMSPMDVDAPLVRIRNLMTCVPHGVTDIDAVCDPLKNTDYAQDICDYLQASERRWTFPKNYLQNNKDITTNVRALLMDWLIQVQHTTKGIWNIKMSHQDLSQYTLHLCVNLIDRFICRQQVQLHMFQLVGVTAMLISSKYYERFPPEITDLCHLTDNTYTPMQVLKMERLMLRKLDFCLNIPGPVVFLERFLLVSPCDKKHLIQSMSMFVLDLTLSDLRFVHIYPSLLAASAIYVSRELLGCTEIWSKAFAYYTKYSENDLQECNRDLRHLLAKMHRSKLKGAHSKYTHANFHGISNHHSLMHISLHPTELWPDQHQEENDKQPSMDFHI